MSTQQVAILEMMMAVRFRCNIFFFFFNDTATTEIYTLSLHDALPISKSCQCVLEKGLRLRCRRFCRPGGLGRGERSEEHTSELRHSQISYAVFCLKKKRTSCDPCLNPVSLL